MEARQGALGGGSLAAGDSFDRCVLVAVLGEIPDKLVTLREVFFSLKPGGMLSVTEMKPDPHFQTEKAVSSLAKQAGFEVNDTDRNRFAFTTNCRKAVSNKTAGGDA